MPVLAPEERPLEGAGVCVAETAASVRLALVGLADDALVGVMNVEDMDELVLGVGVGAAVGWTVIVLTSSEDFVLP